MASLNNDIKYVKTGAGQASAIDGHENGPFQKWNTQPSEEVGYLSAYDQTETEIFTELIPEVVFGGWREHRTVNNTVVFPRGNLYADSEVSTDYVLTNPLTFEGRTGSKDTIYLDHILAIEKIFQRFELESVGANVPAFEVQQAIKGLARVYENTTVQDLVKYGTSAQGLVAFDEEGSCDIYNTLLSIRTKLVNQGNKLENIDIYITPEDVAEIMMDSHYISNGQCDIQASEVRNGFMGRMLGFDLYESGRLYSMNNLNPSYSAESAESKKVNMVIVDRSEVILCRNVIKTISLVDAPTTYIGCVLLTALEYFKHYIVNSYSVMYCNTKYKA